MAFLLHFLLILMIVTIQKQSMSKHTNVYDKAYVHLSLIEDILNN
jgi:hypothetical protein